MPGPRPGRTLAIAALVALAAPAAAQAHLRMGTVAVNLEASVTSSPSDAMRVGVYASDLAVHLELQPGHTLVVRGYLGEPLLRLDPHGLAVNTSSPTAASAGLLAKGQPADRGWQLRQGVHTVTWHDARVRALPPGATTARWTIPILLDGRPTTISGRVRRLRPPSLWPWLVLLALFAATVPAAWHAQRLPAASIALGSLAALAAVLTAAGFALDPYASPGTRIEGIDETIFAAAAAAALFLAPHVWRVAAGGGLGLLALAVGLSKGAMFLDADVLSVFPGAVARTFAVVALSAGAAAAISAGLWFTSERPDPISRMDVV